MIDWLLDDGIVTLTAVLVGFVIGRREYNLRRPVTYRCDCTHPLAMHHPGDGKKVSTSCMKCDCRQYIGQRPIELDSGL